MTETVATTEQLLASWREAQRELDALDPFTPGRADVESRVREAHAAYRARVNGIEAEPTADESSWSSFPEAAEAR